MLTILTTARPLTCDTQYAVAGINWRISDKGDYTGSLIFVPVPDNDKGDADRAANELGPNHFHIRRIRIVPSSVDDAVLPVGEVRGYTVEELYVMSSMSKIIAKTVADHYTKADNPGAQPADEKTWEEVVKEAESTPQL